MNPFRAAAPSERGLPAKPGGGVFRAEQGAGLVWELRRTEYSPRRSAPPPSRRGADCGSGRLAAVPSERGLPAKPGGGIFRAEAVRLPRECGDPFARDLFDLRGDRRNVVVDGMSAISQDEQSLRFEERGPSVVGILSFFREMPPTVDFDDQLGAMAVEIRNVAADRFLALEPEGHLAEPAVPKTPLLVRHVGAKRPGPRDEVVAVAEKVGMCGRHGTENSKAGRRRQTGARSTPPCRSAASPLSEGGKLRK